MSKPSAPDSDSARAFGERAQGSDWMRLDASPSGVKRDAPASARRPPLPQIAGYELLGEIGYGPTSAVYKAREITSSRLVAIKLFADSLANAPEKLARVHARGEALRDLAHPNVAQILAVGDIQGRPYFVMEILEGFTLAQWMRRTPPTASQAAAILEPLARALHHAHEQNIVHARLSTARIQCSTTATTTRAGDSGGVPASVCPKIVGFRIPDLMPDMGVGALARSGGLDVPQYLAPEQVQDSGIVGPAADIWALGVILYEMLAGHPPFDGGSTLETVSILRSREPVPISEIRPHTPPDIEAICFRCLEKNPAKRYRSAGDLANDLANFLNGRPIRAPRPRIASEFHRWRTRYPRLSRALLIALAVLLATSFLSTALAAYFAVRLFGA